MSGVIQSLCVIIDSHVRCDGVSVFSVKCLQNVGEIFWHMIINQELNRDYNLMEKITSRLENDLQLLTKKVTIQQWSP